MFSGGREFQFPGGAIVRGSNITPDDETGIGKWSKETLVERFKMYADTAFVSPTVNPGDFNTVMPWLMYCQMTEQDLSAIYEYLRTIEPVRNQVVKFSRADAEVHSDQSE